MTVRDTWTRQELHNVILSLWVISDHMPEEVKVISRATLAAVARALGLLANAPNQQEGQISTGTLFPPDNGGGVA